MTSLAQTTDSTATPVKPVRLYSTTLTVRTHSKGLFSFSGRLISNNPTADIYFNYTHSNHWGFQAFKAVDMHDLHGEYNFSLALAFRHIPVGKKLTITPYAGVFMEQAHALAGHGSDFVSMMMTSYKLTPQLTVEYLALFPSLLIQRHDTDWVNRFRLLYSHKHLDVALWSWHNNQVIDHASYNSSGMSIYYSRIPVYGKLTLSMGVTGLVVLNTTDTEACPRRNGMVFTVAGTWH